MFNIASFLGILLLLTPGRFASAQAFRVTPDSPKQGELLQVFGDSASRKARLNGAAFPLYLQANSSDTLGLVPVPVKIQPGEYKLEWLDEHGVSIHSEEIHIRNAHYLVQNVELTPQLAQLHSSSDERNAVTKFFTDETAVRFWQFPIAAPLNGCLTSPFGVQRAHNGKLTGDIHAGLDQRAPMGAPIHAVTAGDVRITGEYPLHGGTVGLDHGQGLKSMYLHMSRIAVKTGDHVAAGDVIGYVGSTGRSTGPHLHWALYVEHEPVNPLQWITVQPCAKKPARTSKPNNLITGTHK